ncbi:hypothetical protein C3L33_16116, partial [Rhododendron williamsianum]
MIASRPVAELENPRVSFNPQVIQGSCYCQLKSHRSKTLSFNMLQGPIHLNVPVSRIPSNIKLVENCSPDLRGKGALKKQMVGLRDENWYYPLDWNPPQNVPSCLLSHLKVIEIRFFEGEKEEWEMVQYFLCNAKVLEKVHMRYSDERDCTIQITP